MDFDRQYRTYRAEIDAYLSKFLRQKDPRTLYGPIRYVLEGGGKRLRSVLVLLACEAVGGSRRKALHAGAAMEILHNFTLVHDDIMDNARSRRGRETVHIRWDPNVAILVGDELLALALRALLRTDSGRIHEMTKVFTEGVVEVCEGQAYDKEFESRRTVRLKEYLLMIQKKTAKLVSVSTVLGGLVGNASPAQLRALQRYGHWVGRAFQVQDDLLDIVGNEATLGKSIGGDIREGKKTYLFLHALEHARGSDRQMLLSLARNGSAPEKMVKEFQRIYHETGAIESARRRIAGDIRRARATLRHLPDTQARAMLHWLTDMLLHRTY